MEHTSKTLVRDGGTSHTLIAVIVTNRREGRGTKHLEQVTKARSLRPRILQITFPHESQEHKDTIILLPRMFNHMHQVLVTQQSQMI